MRLLMASPWKDPKTGMYKIRRAVPRALQPILKQRFYVRTLRTKDPREAKRRFAEAFAESERIFGEARDRARRIDVLTDEQIAKLAETYAATILEEDEEERVRGVDDSGFRKAQEMYEIVYYSEKQQLARGDTHLIEDDLDDYLQSHGFNVPKDSESYRKAAYAFLRASVWAAEQCLKRQQGEPVPTPKAPGLGPKRVPEAPTGDTISAIFDSWRAERQPSKKLWDEWQLARRRFVEINGDLPVTAITRAHAREFKDTLLRSELAKSTVTKQIAALRSVLGWAAENGYIEHNPAAGMRLRDAKAPRERRLPYDHVDLKLIFSSGVYTAGERPDAGAGEAAFWLPLIALSMGCRLEEIGQAAASDVKFENGVRYLHIHDRDGETSVKTSSSRRRVPLHPELVRLGFLDYLDRVPAKGRLFPDLRPDHYGKLTGNWSKWWGRYARELGIKDSRKVFHSFRHSFQDACRAARMPEEIRESLAGRTRGEVGDAYGQGHPLEVLSEWIGKIGFGDVLKSVPMWRARNLQENTPSELKEAAD